MDKFNKKNLNGEVSMKKYMPKFHISGWKRRLSLVLVFTLLCSTFMYPGWYKPKEAEAAITIGDAWPATPQMTGTTGNPNTTNFAISAGSNRLLVVAVGLYNSGANIAGTVSATYGGKPLTQAVSEIGGGRRGSWIGYLKEADISTRSGDTVAITITGGNNTGVTASVASYQGVDQTTPIAGTSTLIVANVNNVQFATAATVNDGGYGVYVFGSSQTRTSDTETYTEHSDYLNAAFQYGVASKAFATGTTTRPTVAWAANAYASGSLVTLNQLSCVDPDPSTITISAAQTANGSPYDVSGMKATTGDVGSFEYKVTGLSSPTLSTLDAWTLRASSAPATATGTNVSQGTLAVSAGTDRLFIAGVCFETSANTALGGTMSARLGGTSLTQIQNSMSVLAAREHCWMGYLPNASIPAGTQTLDLSWNTGTTATITGMHVYWGSYSDVDQTTPINASGRDATADLVPQFNAAINYTAGGRTVYVAGNGGAGPITMTPPTDFSQITTSGTNGHGSFVAETANHSASGSYVNTTTVTFTGTTSLRSGLVVASINKAAPSAVICTDWTSNASIPATTAGGSLCGDYVDGGTYTLDVRGTDPDCGGTLVTTTPTNFTWNACVETATVAVTEPVINPIMTPTEISATLGGSGGSNAQVSDDNAIWHASPWTYSPPAPNQTGTVTFYARATGACGTITDATPVTVNYDTTFPVVTSTTPADSAIGVALDSTVTINWSENVDCTTVNTTNITISPAVGWTRTSCSGSQAVFTPSGQANFTDYTVTVGTGVKDSGGMNMDSNYIFSYRTIAPVPTVSSTTPNSGRQDETLDVSIYGSEFVTGATADFGAGITVNSTNMVNSGELTANITIATGATLGTRTVTVNNPDSQSGTLPGSFTVNAGICIRNVPEVTLSSYGTVDPGSAKAYPLQVKNNDNSFCSNSTFAISISSETGNTGSFVQPSALDSATTGPLAPGSTYNTTLTVTAQAGATIGHTLTTSVDATDNTNHSGQSASASVLTRVVLWVNDNLLHNSTNATLRGSTKNYWSGQGGWGVPNGVYGGFNCDTCHTKNDSANIKRIKETISVPDISKGNIPGSTVSLLSTSGNVNGFGDDQSPTGSSTRICEVCHTQPGKHKYGQTAADSLHENTAATPANYQDCTLCHEHKKGFVTPGCIDCHDKQQGQRAPVVGQFSSESHHIQGVTLTNNHCYQCHWEANDNGSINYTYHLGWRNGLAATSNSPVNLVIYGSTARPTAAYSEGVNGIAYTAVPQSRTELAKINTHCLSCHDEDSASITPFGDTKTPTQYAWDGMSIASKYSNALTTTWGKYSGNFTAPKNIAKAYSAHGNAAANKIYWNITTGYDNNMTGLDFSGNVNVVCFDCHNSHGSSVAGTTTSYTAGAGVTNSGIFKDVTNGLGGYTVTYKPAAGGSAANKNVYNAGGALCFDCHMETAATGSRPWGYDTFGATAKIQGYQDTAYFDLAFTGPQQRYTYKQGRGTSKGGHFGRSSDLLTTPMGTIDGLCTPCHDPHGVTDNTAKIAAANKQYGVPLLKGTWITSPYKEDAAPANINEPRGGGGRATNPNQPALTVGSTPGYTIDQNTFQAIVSTNLTGYPRWNFATNASTLMTHTADQFAGLCLTCHQQTDLLDAASRNTWKGLGRVHDTVKGWGTVGGNNGNTVHAYTCSKCHAPHNSGLPRLLVTNCIDSNHRGRVASGGNVGASTGNTGAGDAGTGRGRYPAGGGGYGDSSSVWAWPRATQGAYFFGNPGTSRTTPPAVRACHDNAPGNSGTYPTFEQWNSKSPW